MSDHYHSRHGGRLGRTDEKLAVTYCAWCVVGWEDEAEPQRRLEYHLEGAHPKINRGMWEERDAKDVTP